MSDGPIDRSDPSDKHVYGRTQKFYRWRNDVIGKLRGGKVKSLGMKVCHNASGKCQMVRSIDRIHRTSLFTVGQKFYRWRNDVIGKLRGGKVKSLGMKVCHNVSGKCQMVRSIDRIHRTSLFTVGQKFYRWQNDVIAKLHGGKVKRLGMKVCHNVSGKCQMVRSIDRIHRTSVFTVGQKFSDGEEY